MKYVIHYSQRQQAAIIEAPLQAGKVAKHGYPTQIRMEIWFDSGVFSVETEAIHDDHDNRYPMWKHTQIDSSQNTAGVFEALGAKTIESKEQIKVAMQFAEMQIKVYFAVNGFEISSR